MINCLVSMFDCMDENKTIELWTTHHDDIRI